MRHKLNNEEFLFNIDQLGQLSRNNAKTVLLGRPSAFMDENEYEYVVHGKKSEHALAAAATAYQEIHISPLSRQQITDYVERYCSWRFPHKHHQQAVLRVIFGPGNKVLHGIAQRPIQLMMLLEIFPELPKKLDLVTKATVYSLFIDQLIDREKSTKKTRLFSKLDQRRFGREVAWWLWEQGGKSRIEAKHIPIEVFAGFVKPEDDMEATRRGLVAASFLSTEGGTRLHFPHRSIQEFFVAEHLLRALETETRLKQSIRGFRRVAPTSFQRRSWIFWGRNYRRASYRRSFHISTECASYRKRSRRYRMRAPT